MRKHERAHARTHQGRRTIGAPERKLPERAESFPVIVFGGRDGGDHDRPRVAAERILEQPGEHGVAVRDENHLLRRPARSRASRLIASVG